MWLLVACSDYRVGTKPDPVVAPDHTGVETTEPEPTGDTAPPDHTAAPTCADTELPTFAWTAGPPFTTFDDPVDAALLPFWDPAAAPADFGAVGIPDRGIPIGTDRAYRAEFTLDEVPVDLSLDLQSDDGITVWLNGAEVGRWGGAWQQEGCVNDRAGCVVTTRVAPFEVTPLLLTGDNVLAARVSNPVQNAYFSLTALCVDR